MEKKSLAWGYSYMLGITSIICILAALVNKITLMVISIVFLINIVGIIVLWTRPLSKKSLYLLNIFNILAASSFAYLIIAFLIDSIESFVVMITIIVVMDVFSFTKKGKMTPNARLMNNNNALARLCICLPVPKKPGLQPVIGVGDLYFYSAIMFFSLHTFGVSVLGKVFLLIFVGQLTNIILISIIKNKVWYKGFPATLFPGAFYLVGLLSRFI